MNEVRDRFTPVDYPSDSERLDRIVEILEDIRELLRAEATDRQVAWDMAH